MRILTITAVLGFFLSSLAPAQSLPQGTVTLTKARGDALAVWDATNELTAIVAQKPTKKDALAQLESDAALIFGNRAPALNKRAKTLSVLVLYTKTGAISPTYHTATFEGVERLLTFKAFVRQSAQAAQWAQELRAGHPVRAVSITVTGQLPPELP
ncbi:MAG: hypothetical protein JOZ59_00535 [Candidatus Eremiobacteraeota bacterium]|nr:hypothetical protein [Candidatus Eremiobacteraeota bacterium]